MFTKVWTFDSVRTRFSVVLSLVMFERNPYLSNDDMQELQKPDKLTVHFVVDDEGDCT